jgi:hypothetical protein
MYGVSLQCTVTLTSQTPWLTSSQPPAMVSEGMGDLSLLSSSAGGRYTQKIECLVDGQKCELESRSSLLDTLCCKVDTLGHVSLHVSLQVPGLDRVKSSASSR